MTTWTPLLSDVLIIIGRDGTKLAIGVNEVFEVFQAIEAAQTEGAISFKFRSGYWYTIQRYPMTDSEGRTYGV